MVAIAQQLDAAVQGDDGEIYERGGQAPRQQALSLSKRVAGWFARLRPQRPVKSAWQDGSHACVLSVRSRNSTSRYHLAWGTECATPGAMSTR
jgi:hypothetical protein